MFPLHTCGCDSLHLGDLAVFSLRSYQGMMSPAVQGMASLPDSPESLQSAALMMLPFSPAH